MDSTPNWIEFVAASGVGGLIVAMGQGVLSYFSETRSRSFSERKAAYSGYLSALNRSQTIGTKEGEHPNQRHSDLKLAELNCEVLGNSLVRKALREIEASNHDHDVDRRKLAMENLLLAIRNDLGIAQK